MNSTPPARPVVALLTYVVAVFLGGALLAPWLYLLCQNVSFLQPLANNPFSDFENRSLLFLALAGLWPLLRSLGVTSWKELGLVNLRNHQKLLGAGFMAGLISLATAVLMVVLCHGRVINTTDPAAKYVKHLLAAAMSAVAVSLLEEVLFRGGIFGALRRAFNWRAALIASSAIYAILHFFKSAAWEGPVTWHSGLEMLPRMAAGFLDTQSLFPSFLNLTLVGIILALAYQRTGNLWFSIGLHGGWVFWVKFYGFLTDKAPDANIRLWGTSRLIDGWMTCLVLLATLLVAQRFLKGNTPESHGNAG